MNRKQFIILLVLLVLIGAAGWVVHQRGRNSWQSGGQTIGQKLLPALAVNDIAQVLIRSGTNELNLARRDNLWRVRERGDYPANFSEISGLLLKFADLKVAQSQDVGASQLGRFELLPPGAGANAGTLVEFKSEAGKTLSSVFLGKKHLSKSGGAPFESMGAGGRPDGRYVMVGGEAKTLAVISDPLDNVQPKPEAWLSKDFFSIEKPRSIAVQFPEATNSWKLTRASETNEWQLADAGPDEKADPTKVSGVTSPFASASFNDVFPGNTQPEISGLTNVTTMTVETFDGFAYTFKIGQKQSESYPVTLSVAAVLPTERTAGEDAKPDDKTKLDKEFKDRQKNLTDKLAREKQFANWIYRLPGYAVDSTLKRRDQLLTESKAEPAATVEK